MHTSSPTLRVRTLSNDRIAPCFHNGAKSRFELLSDPGKFGAGGPNQNTSRRSSPLTLFVGTIARFIADPRVRWWEIFNEPRRDAYSLGTWSPNSAHCV